MASPERMEYHQQQQNLVQISDDEYELIMELSEKDFLYEKKKKLLEVKGFDPNGKVKVKNTCSIESVNSILEEILERARIIHSDEVDLYFGGTDACSPRNELESLHAILSLVEKSKSKSTGGEEMRPEVFQDLWNATLNKIHEFGHNVIEDAKIVSSWNLDMEKCLLQWGESNGVKSKLDIAYIEGAGRGAIARKDLEVGDIALEIPLSAIISEDLIYKTTMFRVLEKVEGISSETMLLLWSMKEKHDTNSKFKIYFDTLPEEFNTGLSFGMEAVMALDGTLLLEEIVQAKEHLRSQYDGLIPSLCNNFPDIFPPNLYSWEKFLWACELWYSNSMKVMFNDGKLRTCLIPIAGFLNHSVSPHIMNYGRVDPTTNSLKFPISRPCKKGGQCYLSYGNLSSSHLITFYGFLPKGDNPYDVIPLGIFFFFYLLFVGPHKRNRTGCTAFGVGTDVNGAKIAIFCSAQKGLIGTILDMVESTQEMNPMSNWSTHMVRGTWLSKNHGIFNYGLPIPLLENLREARLMLDSDLSEQEKLEVELEVLEDLHSTFDAMMENLTETEPLVRENCDWDVKLALDFKDLQRRIVSSIISSCYAGRKLVEQELHNCKRA